MNPADLVPVADAIPVSWGWFYFLLLLTFLLHLLVMNAMLGFGIIAFISSLRRKKEYTDIAREVSRKWPYTIAFAVNMGVAPLLFLQVLYGHFIYTSSILMAVFWLSIVVMVILAYYSAYICNFHFEKMPRGRVVLIGFSSLLMLVIAFFFSNNMTLMLQPERWLAYFGNRQGTLLNLSDPILWPRYFHFVVGSIALAGLILALLARFGLVKDEVDRALLAARGLKYFVHATMLQVLVGIWFLLALPSSVVSLFIGGSVYGAALISVGVVLAMLALVLGFRGKLLGTVISTFLLLIVMILMRDMVRSAYLRPYFSLSDLEVVPQYSPLLLFLVVFFIGLGLIVYMLKLAFAGGREGQR